MELDVFFKPNECLSSCSFCVHDTLCQKWCEKLWLCPKIRVIYGIIYGIICGIIYGIIYGIICGIIYGIIYGKYMVNIWLIYGMNIYIW